LFCMLSPGAFSHFMNEYDIVHELETRFSTISAIFVPGGPRIERQAEGLSAPRIDDGKRRSRWRQGSRTCATGKIEQHGGQQQRGIASIAATSIAAHQQAKVSCAGRGYIPAEPSSCEKIGMNLRKPYLSYTQEVNLSACRSRCAMCH
jgi:hypothetical protein